MNTEILDKYWEYLRQKYRSKSTKYNYHRFVRLFLNWLQENKGKTYEDLTPRDTKEYKAFCLETYKVNGNVGRLNAINNFVDKFLQNFE